MNKTQTQLPTETWITATWQEYIQTIEDPTYEKAKVYYHNGKLRIEMSPVGSAHASDHAFMITALTYSRHQIRDYDAGFSLLMILRSQR